MNQARASLRPAGAVGFGDVAVEAAGPLAAVCYSPGAQPKTQPSVDAIEDVVAARSEGDHYLLLLGDGHHGRDAAVLIIEALLDAFQFGLPERPIPSQDMVAAISSANDLAWKATRGLDYPRRGSRTTLLLAMSGPGWLQWAAVGDSSAWLVEGDGARQLGAARADYLGGPLEPSHISQLVETGVEPFAPGQWVVLASDGYADWCPHPHELTETFTDPTSAFTAAASLAHRAVRANAHDHISIAVGGR